MYMRVQLEVQSYHNLGRTVSKEASHNLNSMPAGLLTRLQAWSGLGCKGSAAVALKGAVSMSQGLEDAY